MSKKTAVFPPKDFDVANNISGRSNEWIDISRTQIPGEFFSGVNREEEGDLNIPHPIGKTEGTHLQTGTSSRLGFSIAKGLDFSPDIQMTANAGTGSPTGVMVSD